jgi:hypothetical protein
VYHDIAMAQMNKQFLDTRLCIVSGLKVDGRKEIVFVGSDGAAGPIF